MGHMLRIARNDVELQRSYKDHSIALHPQFIDTVRRFHSTAAIGGSIHDRRIIWFLVLPLLVLELVLKIICFRDWLHRSRFNGLPRLVWVVCVPSGDTVRAGLIYLGVWEKAQ